MSVNNGGRNRPRNGNGFDNPEFSPGVQLISSGWDKTVQTKLDQFSQSDEIELLFPPMFNHERKRVHELARRHGLQSTSQGKEPYRSVFITRKKKISMVNSLKASETRPIDLNNEMKRAISSFMEKHPVTEEVIRDYLFDNKSSKSRSRHSDFTKEYALLLPPKSNVSPEMMAQRQQLPAAKQRHEILDAIKKHQVVLITGGTGCGKTTQVPQFLMENANENGSKIRIICTQPRRLPAIAVAERVAKERNEKCGHVVGYHIRLEQKTSSQTVLTYCTSGVLLRMLTDDEIAKDVSHIILDEIHEREQNTDYLLIALKQAVQRRKDLKIILMSATMEGNLKLFKSYFGENINTKHVDIPSRLYHVEKFYLSDVLAMTGYIPDTNFISGSFDSTFKESASFPNVTSWNADTASVMPNSASVSNFKATSGFGPNSKTEWDGDKWNTISTTPVNSFSQQFRSRPANVTPFNAPGVGCSQSYSQNAFHSVAHQLARSQQTAPNQSDYYGSSVDNQQYSSECPIAVSADSAPYNQSVIFHPDQFSHPPPPLGQPIQHSVTWCSPSNDNIYYDPAIDIVDLPTGHIDAESLAELQKMSNENMYDETTPNWTHTQSLSSMPQQDNGSLHHWEQQISYPANVQKDVPQFYIPQENFNSQPLGIGFGTSFAAGENSFGAQLQRERMEVHRMKQTITASLADRYTTFTPQITEKLKSRHIDHRSLVDHYMRLGGSEYAETVDVFLVKYLVKHCMDSMVDGAILVFLPGFEDITQVRDKLMAEIWDKKTPVILTLHSQMNSYDQQRVFDSVPFNTRKVILSTNIAEASLTIDDVVFVIDCGKVKEKSYDHTSRISQLKVSWIAKSNAEQRAGRAGRCRPGYCFRLYSLDNYSDMLSTQTAEMQRAAIHDVVLHARMFSPEHMSVKDFLSLAPEPPLTIAIEHSMQFLEVLGAMYSTASTSDINVSTSFSSDAEPDLTSMGRLIAHLPLDPQLARLLLFGVALKCLSPIVTLVAALSHRDPFTICGPEERERSNLARDRFALRDLSDHVTLLRIMHEFDRIHNNTREQGIFCRANFLSGNVLRMVQGIRRQLLVELKRAKLIYYEGDVMRVLKDPQYNRYSESWPMVQAAIVAGCYPGIGVVKNNNTKLRKIRISDDEMASLHPSSVIRRQAIIASKAPSDTDPLFQLLAYQEISRMDDGLALRQVSIVPPIVVLLFAGPIRLKKSTIIQFQLDQELEDVVQQEKQEPRMGFDDFMHSIYEVDDHIVFKGPHQYFSMLLKLRVRVMLYFLDVMQNPRLLTTSQEDHESLLATLNTVLSEEHKVENFNPVSDFAVTPDRDVHSIRSPHDVSPPKQVSSTDCQSRLSKSDVVITSAKPVVSNTSFRSENIASTEHMTPSASQHHDRREGGKNVFSRQKQKPNLLVKDSKLEERAKQSELTDKLDRPSASMSCDVRNFQSQTDQAKEEFWQSDRNINRRGFEGDQDVRHPLNETTKSGESGYRGSKNRGTNRDGKLPDRRNSFSEESKDAEYDNQLQRNNLSSSFRQNDTRNTNYARNVNERGPWNQSRGSVHHHDSQRLDERKGGSNDFSHGRQRSDSYRGVNKPTGANNRRGNNRHAYDDRTARLDSKNWKQGGDREWKNSKSDAIERSGADGYYEESPDNRSSASQKNPRNKYTMIAHEYNDRPQYRSRATGAIRDHGKFLNDRTKNSDRDRERIRPDNISPIPDYADAGCDDVRLEQKDRKTWQQLNLEQDGQRYRKDRVENYEHEDVPEDPKVDRNVDSWRGRKRGGYKPWNSDRNHRSSFKNKDGNDHHFWSNIGENEQDDRPRQNRDDSDVRGARKPTGGRQVFYSKNYRRGK